MLFFWGSQENKQLHMIRKGVTPPFKGIIQRNKNKLRKTGLNFPNEHTMKNPNKTTT